MDSRTQLSCAAISQPALTNGWLDTPSRYLDAASRSRQNVAEAGLGEELPPAKRRKTLTDSIIGTALSAALIGTAVGMTAYRMWRDRGIPSDIPSGDSTEQPPPPYEKEEWLDEAPHNKISSPTPRRPRKSRTITRRTPRRRMAPVIISPARSPIRMQSLSICTVSQSGQAGSERGELDEQMDWMCDKIRGLITEGQRALGKEVVIMGDEPDGEDAVDDGLEGWEEFTEDNHRMPSPHRLLNIHQGPSRPSHGFSTTPSISLPVRSGSAVPGSFVSSSLSPRSKRSRTHVVTPKQGTTRDGNSGVKVLYEPTTATSSLDIDNVPDDEDSRALTERMERIRQAYRIQ